MRFFFKYFWFKFIRYCDHINKNTVIIFYWLTNYSDSKAFLPKFNKCMNLLYCEFYSPCFFYYYYYIIINLKINQLKSAWLVNDIGKLAVLLTMMHSK